MGSRRNIRRSAGRGAMCLLLCLGSTFSPSRAQDSATPATPVEPSVDRAVQLYDEARYPEAREMLEQLDGQGKLGGALLYRLYYCQNLASAPEAPRTLERAVDALAREVATDPSLESAFYLVNAYSNRGMSAEARALAASATERFDSAAAPEPDDPIDRFRLGKLYADQQKGAQAERWYAAAVPGLQATGSNAAYVQWASRYLADATFSRGEFTETEPYLTLLTEAERPSPVDLDRLAVCRARIGMYAESAAAWRRIERIDPANADRARYSSRLADAASRLPGYSVAAPDGRLWTQLTRSEIETILKEQAAEARAVHEQGKDWKSLDPARKKELQDRLDRSRPVFVGAGLEFTLQGHDIRQAAFSGGYAPLIFHDSEWRLPKRPLVS